MTANTKIEWADHTFNPWIGCTKVSLGCDRCYAEADFDKRRHIVQWGQGQARKRTAPSTWAMPIKWDREAKRLGVRHRVFCASLADVFDNEVDPQWLEDLFVLIAYTPNLDWLLLTKRIGNALRMVDDGRWFPSHWPNVWLGASIVNQEEADRDIPKLLAIPAHKRFLSMEPLLGPVDIRKFMWPVHPRWPAKYNTPAEAIADGVEVTYHRQALISKAWADQLVNWVIVGGESGHGARPMHPDWARSLRDQCTAAGVPFLFKQWGEFLPALANGDDPTLDAPDSKLFWSDGQKWDRFDGQRAAVDLVARVGKKAAGRLLDGRTWDEVPA